MNKFIFPDLGIVRKSDGASIERTPGITKLDLAAMMVLQGMYSNPLYTKSNDSHHNAKLAIRAAIALVERLEEEGNN